MRPHDLHEQFLVARDETTGLAPEVDEVLHYGESYEAHDPHMATTAVTSVGG